MISKSALDIAALLRAVRGKVAKSASPTLDEHYKRVLQTADPQYAQRLGQLLTSRLSSAAKPVMKTAELDSSVAVPASAAILGASAVAGGMPLAKYLKESAPYHGKAIDTAYKEGIKRLRWKALMSMPSIIKYLNKHNLLNKTASDSEDLAALAGIAGVTGLGTGALLAAGSKARDGSKLLKNVQKGTGVAIALPALYYAAKRLYANKDNAKLLFNNTVDAVKAKMGKTAEEADFVPYAVAGGAGLAGAAAGAYPVARLMDKRIRRDAVEAAVIDALTGNAHNNTPKAMKYATRALGALGLGLGGYGAYQAVGKPLINLYRQLAPNLKGVPKQELLRTFLNAARGAM